MVLPKISSEECGYYIPKKIAAQLEKSRNTVIKADQDRVYCVDGREGLGKSTLALQLAYAVDPTFNLERVCFNADEFEQVIKKVNQFTAIVFDEAFNGLSSKGALSKENKKLVRLLMECRQRNLFIFIVLPSVFLLEKYVAVFRSQSLFHVYNSKANPTRRYYKIFNYGAKKVLYLFGKQLLSYNKPHVFQSFRFYGKKPRTIVWEEYVKKKLNAFREREIKNPEEVKYKLQRDLIIQANKHILGHSAREQANAFAHYDIGLKKSQIINIISDSTPTTTDQPTTL